LCHKGSVTLTTGVQACENLLVRGAVWRPRTHLSDAAERHHHMVAWTPDTVVSVGGCVA
jgi:hypothetical protein